jgi:hypothetical protein
LEFLSIQSLRLLVVTLFTEEVNKVNRTTSEKCNETILSLADQVVVGYANRGGQLEKVLVDTLYLLL